MYILTEAKHWTSEDDQETAAVDDSGMLFMGEPISPIWPDEPALWFAKLEARFALANITADLSKFEFVCSQLREKEHILTVEDILSHPPETNKYECIKTRLIQKLAKTLEQRVDQIVNREVLGDRKPSQFLRRLKRLAGDDLPESFVRDIWRSRLPTDVQQVVILQPDATLEEISRIADVAHDIMLPIKSRAASAAPGASSDVNAMIAELTKKVDALSVEVEKLKRANMRSRSRQRSSSSRGNNRRVASRTRSQSSYRKYPLCWYHATFGNSAVKCVMPCDW